jgi:hypothetical protein
LKPYVGDPTLLDFNHAGRLAGWEARCMEGWGVAPFQVDCPACGRDSDAPETPFLAGPLAPVRDTAFLLCRIKCEGRGAAFDRVFRPIDAAGLAGFPEIEEPKPEAAGLLARYEALEAGYRQEWEALYAVASDESFGTRGIDLAGCSVAPRLGRPTAADPRLLHVSVSQSLALGLPSQLEAGFLVSLYYAPDELARLCCAKGNRWPLFHYWLPWPIAENAGE